MSKKIRTLANLRPFAADGVSEVDLTRSERKALYEKASELGISYIHTIRPNGVDEEEEEAWIAACEFCGGWSNYYLAVNEKRAFIFTGLYCAEFANGGEYYFDLRKIRKGSKEYFSLIEHYQDPEWDKEED